MASITLNNLVKAYGDVEVLHHVDGEISRRAAMGLDVGEAVEVRDQ